MKKLFTSTTKLASPVGQGADYVELFFDLVFVFAITRITSVTADHLDGIHVLQSVLIFWLIWWGWTQFTWALNAANTKIPEIRMGVLIATGVAFVLASSVDEAFTNNVFWFAVPYIILRALGLGLYLRVTSGSEEESSATKGFALFSITGLVAVLAGAMVDPSQRTYWWLSAIFLDMLAGFIGGSSKGWKLHAKHFVERHGLIVIIALGESLIVAASAIDTQERSFNLILSGGLALAVTCLLWWSYFAWIHEYLEGHFPRESGAIQAGMARDAYSFIHFPVICGIIGIALGFEQILSHPNTPLAQNIALSLSIGFALFIGFTAASVWRISKLVLYPRIIIIIISCIGVILSIGLPSYIALLILVLNLLALIFIEWKKCHAEKSLNI